MLLYHLHIQCRSFVHQHSISYLSQHFCCDCWSSPHTKNLKHEKHLIINIFWTLFVNHRQPFCQTIYQLYKLFLLLNFIIGREEPRVLPNQSCQSPLCKFQKIVIHQPQRKWEFPGGIIGQNFYKENVLLAQTGNSCPGEGQESCNYQYLEIGQSVNQRCRTDLSQQLLTKMKNRGWLRPPALPHFHCLWLWGTAQLKFLCDEIQCM